MNRARASPAWLTIKRAQSITTNPTPRFLALGVAHTFSAPLGHRLIKSSSIRRRNLGHTDHGYSASTIYRARAPWFRWFILPEREPVCADKERLPSAVNASHIHPLQCSPNSLFLRYFSRSLVAPHWLELPPSSVRRAGVSSTTDSGVLFELTLVLPTSLPLLLSLLARASGPFDVAGPARYVTHEVSCSVSRLRGDDSWVLFQGTSV